MMSYELPIGWRNATFAARFQCAHGDSSEWAAWIEPRGLVVCTGVCDVFGIDLT